MSKPIILYFHYFLYEGKAVGRGVSLTSRMGSVKVGQDTLGNPPLTLIEGARRAMAQARDAKRETKSDKILKYEQFLNERLKDDLK